MAPGMGWGWCWGRVAFGKLGGSVLPRWVVIAQGRQRMEALAFWGQWWFER